MFKHIIFMLIILVFSSLTWAQNSCSEILRKPSEVQQKLISLGRSAAEQSADLWNDMELFYAFTHPRDTFRDKLFISQAKIRHEVLLALKPASLNEVDEYSSLIALANLEYIRSYKGNNASPQMLKHIFERRNKEVFDYIYGSVNAILNPVPLTSNRDYFSPVSSFYTNLFGSLLPLDDNDFPILEPDDVFSDENIDLISKILSSLTSREKEIYILHQAYGKSMWEIASRFRMSEEAVRRAFQSAVIKVDDTMKTLYASSEEVKQAFINGRIEEERFEYKEHLEWLARELPLIFLDIRKAAQLRSRVEEVKALEDKISQFVDKNLDRSLEIDGNSIEELRLSYSKAMNDFREAGSIFIGEVSNLIGITTDTSTVGRARRNFTRYMNNQDPI